MKRRERFPFLLQGEEGVYLKLRVQPRASRNGLDGVLEGALKIRLTAPPVEGEANRAVAAFLSKLLGISKNSITIAAGLRSKNKKVCIRGLAIKDIERVFEDLLSS